MSLSGKLKTRSPAHNSREGPMPAKQPRTAIGQARAHRSGLGLDQRKLSSKEENSADLVVDTGEGRVRARLRAARRRAHRRRALVAADAGTGRSSHFNS